MSKSVHHINQKKSFTLLDLWHYEKFEMQMYKTVIFLQFTKFLTP